MQNFIGGFGQDGQPKPMTFLALQRHTDTWPVTKATPEGPAMLLRLSREMFAHAFFVYEFAAASCAWSLFGVEAALKLRLQKNASLKELIELAEERGLIRPGSGEIVDAGRKIRNRFVHEGKQPAWTFGMADRALRSSHIIVAELFPDAAP
jgi:hypothetical protein